MHIDIHAYLYDANKKNCIYTYLHAYMDAYIDVCIFTYIHACMQHT